MRKNGGVNWPQSARNWRAMEKGVAKCMREKERMREEEERPRVFVHGSMSCAKLNGMTHRAPYFGVTRDTWWLLYGLLWSHRLLWHDWLHVVPHQPVAHL
jgi:hypothetical protein